MIGMSFTDGDMILKYFPNTGVVQIYKHPTTIWGSTLEDQRLSRYRLMIRFVLYKLGVY